MFDRLASLVTRRWSLVIVVWLFAVVAVRIVAPRWDSVTHDGDFAYLPAHMPSVAGERWMTEAFPRQRGRSQVVVAIVRQDAEMTKQDIQVAYDVARRMKNLFGAARVAAARELARQEVQLREAGEVAEAGEIHSLYNRAIEQASEALQDALLLDERLADYWGARTEESPALADVRPPRLPEIYHNLALLDVLRDDSEAAAKHRELAVQLDPSLADAGKQVLPAEAAELPFVDAWTWRESYFGDKLISHDNCVRLIVLQLTNEFMAVDNIHVVSQIEAELEPVREHIDDWTSNGLAVLQSGSAAVGADLLRSAASSIKHTEMFTIVLVVVILALVYRAPLLVALPIVTIMVSLLFSTGLVALLTQLSEVPGFEWWTLKVFSTTKIFIVVILFGAGTDYCLFLIARYKEELQAGLPNDQAVAAALKHVGDALAASALTTILGLSMMFFAEFGKFCYSGPVIGLCLAITLITCTTLTPAIMRGLGPTLFWPFGIERSVGDQADEPEASGAPRGWRNALWPLIARCIVTGPGIILVVSVLLLMPLAAYGVMHANDVTYDFLGGLPRKCPSKQGAEALRAHFPVGESGPVTVLVHKQDGHFETGPGREQIRNLSDQLHLPGILTVRSAEDPLGEYKPGEKSGILSERARRLRVLRAHPRTKAIFVAQTPQLAGTVARFELILDYDPFSLEAVEVVDHVEAKLQQLTGRSGSYWSGAQYALTGTTAAIRDLRAVTQRDNVRIQILVVLAVLVVLLVVLKRPGVCVYMMLTVLFSYFITIGITTWFFATVYGEAYQGLDWKVPLFLFVILVAVGQDYNVYLATRVFEEQARVGPFAGLQRAVVRTGGIITSCGVIMAGTFISMTSGTWGDLIPGLSERVSPPYGALHSIVEMGFALALGVLIDTFIVRTILVPSFLALTCRWRARLEPMHTN